MSPAAESQDSPRLDGLAKDENNTQNVEAAPAVSASTTTDKMTQPSDITSGEQLDEQMDLLELGNDSKTDDKPQSVAASTEESGKEPIRGRPEPLDLLSSSVATLKPTTSPTTTTATHYLTVQAEPYHDPTPSTPSASQPPSRTPSNAASHSRHGSEHSPSRSDVAYDERRYMSEDEQEQGSRSEIQSIMEQFSEEGGGPGVEEVMSPRLEMASPMLGSPVQHPPRKSSLEPLTQSLAQQIHEGNPINLNLPSPASLRAKNKAKEEPGPPVPPKDELLPAGLPTRSSIDLQAHVDSPLSPTVSLHRPPPPEPEPEPALPFDFHRFLEQLRNKKADPVARYLKSFLSEFGKRQWMVHEQVKIISDFLAFIANKMALCEVWRDVSDAEFDNAREGMEKLVMNRLYSQTFSPAIPAPQPLPGPKPKKHGTERAIGPGRRGQHQEDVERDEVLAQKVNIYAWVKEEHLDIPAVSDSGKRFLKLAQQELLKIKSYRAPRDKIICVLNCCKVIFGLLKHSKSDGSADSFMPMLIYVVLHANPEHLVSNVHYILRFRNQEKLGGEAGYYLSSLMGAIQFIENMDRTSLTITDQEFEANVEAAVSAIAERHLINSPVLPPPGQSEKMGLPTRSGEQGSSSRPSYEIEEAQGSAPRQSTSSNEADGEGDEKAAISGLLRSIQRPLSTIGRMFSEEMPGSGAGPSTDSPVHTPLPESQGETQVRQKLSAEESAARQASAEAAEAQRLHRAEHANVVETLAGMFPDLDRDIISDVVYQKEGRVGLAVDACLALSS